MQVYIENTSVIKIQSSIVPEVSINPTKMPEVCSVPPIPHVPISCLSLSGGICAHLAYTPKSVRCLNSQKPLQVREPRDPLSLSAPGRKNRYKREKQEVCSSANCSQCIIIYTLYADPYYVHRSVFYYMAIYVTRLFKVGEITFWADRF